MQQFVVGEDGLISEPAASEEAAWYVSKCAGAGSTDFEAHIMLMRAYAALKVDTPFERRGGLTKARYSILRLLYTAEANRRLMTDIVQEMSVSPTNVTKLVDGLEADDLVRRVDDPHDKRKLWVELMPRGRDVAEEAFPNVARHVASLWVGLTVEEKRVLIHLLSKLRLGILANQA
jgi:MarR family 2-MHQ and catechol resistance regulon transcriptional repressor